LRLLVEHCLGRLKNQFPALLCDLRLAVKNIPTFILACCVLRNLAIQLRMPDPPRWPHRPTFPNEEDEQPNLRGQVIVKRFAERFFADDPQAFATDEEEDEEEEEEGDEDVGDDEDLLDER